MTQSALSVVGFDPAMSNWGIAKGVYDMGTGQLTLQDVSVTSPVRPTGKLVRQNSSDLEAARQLAQDALIAAQGAQAIFVEVPVGSQSARAMASYGICVGILGTLRACGIPFFEVTPLEVKLIAVGKRTATKREMIDWAVARYPSAPWPRYTRNGVQLIAESHAEHMADATAAICAGIASNPFQQMLPVLAQAATNIGKYHAYSHSTN
jgi:hypothetical protein